MILYASLLVVSVAAGYIGRVNRTARRRAIYLAAVAAVLIFFAACRADSVGADTLQFTNGYRLFATQSWREAMANGYEKGFLFLCRLLACISPSPQLLIAFTSIFSITVFTVVLYRNSVDVVMSVALFIGMQYYANYMNYMRQVLAISIVFLAIEFLLKKFRFGWIPYLAVVLLAAMFHITALVLCLLPLFYHIRPTKTLCCVTGVVGLTVFILFEPLVRLVVRIIPKYRPYLGGKFLMGGGMGALLDLGLCLVGFAALLWICLYRERATATDGADSVKASGTERSSGAAEGSQTAELSETAELPKTAELPETVKTSGTADTSGTPELPETFCPEGAHGAGFLLWCAFAAAFADFFTLRAIVMARIAFYFRMYTMIAVPLILSRLPRKYACIARVAVICFALVYGMLILHYRPDWTNVVSYRFFWSADAAA